MHHLSWITYVILTLIGCGAGVVDTIAGGGGLITVPALLMAGLSPAMSLGTNRLQSCIGESTATIRFIQGGELELKKLWLGLIFASIGSTIGTILIQIIHPLHLKKIIAALMLIILIYTIFSPKLAHKSVKPKMSLSLFGLIFGTIIGFYNGFFGPGTGSFYVVAFMFFMAMNIKSAVIHTKPLNLIGNILSFFWFALGGHVAYIVGIFMGIGQMVGAYIGAHFVMREGSRLIKPIFIAAVFLMTINIVWEAFFKRSPIG